MSWEGGLAAEARRTGMTVTPNEGLYDRHGCASATPCTRRYVRRRLAAAKEAGRRTTPFPCCTNGGSKFEEFAPECKAQILFLQGPRDCFGSPRERQRLRPNRATTQVRAALWSTMARRQSAWREASRRRLAACVTVASKKKKKEIHRGPVIFGRWLVDFRQSRAAERFVESSFPRSALLQSK